MAQPTFFEKPPLTTLAEIAALAKAELVDLSKAGQQVKGLASLDEAGRAALGAGATLASRAPADLAGSRLGLLRALLVRDPDGHALLLAESRPAVARPGSP